MSEEPVPPRRSGTVTRVQSGVAALVVLVPLLLFGGFWGAFGLAVFGVLLGVREFIGFALPERPPGTMVVAIVAAELLCVGLALGRFELLAASVCVAVFGSTLWFLFTARSTDGLGDQSARLMMGVAYVGGLVGFLPAVRDLPGGLGWMWLAFGLGWAGDTGGYFTGRAFGRHKMSPLISPKKTWEGFAGGVLLAVLWAFLFKLLFFPSLRVVDCLVLGVLGDAAGVVGDLVESVFKRTYRVKDSGTFLPGHGGFLDRVDSVMFTLPLTYLYVVLCVPTAG